MPVQHTVVFRLPYPAGSEQENAFLDAARAALAPIPGVQGFTIARQVSPKSGLALQFSMVFADDAAYDGYNTHPSHVGFVSSRWDSEVAEFQEYDFVAL